MVRERHWAVGWVEWIAIHESDEKALREADELAAALTDYPIVNESHFSELEWTEANDYWESLSLRERIELCSEAGISIFCARHDSIPPQDSGYIFEHCTA